MTISSTTVKTVTALGNGVNLNHVIGFPFQSNDHIEVYVQDESVTPYTLTQLIYGSGAGKYIITGGDPGTTVLMGTALTATQRALIIRVTPEQQSVDYVGTQAFPADDHESQMDRIVMMNQELAEQVSRSLKLWPTSTDDPTLPSDFDPDTLSTFPAAVVSAEAAAATAAADAATAAAAAATASAAAATAAADAATASAAAASAGISVLELRSDVVGARDGVNQDFTLPTTPIPTSSVFVVVDGAIREIAILSGTTATISASLAAELVNPAMNLEFQYVRAELGPVVAIGANTPFYHTISAGEAVSKSFVLPYTPIGPTFIILDTPTGPATYGTDYTVTGDTVSWVGLGLDGVLNAGDAVRVIDMVAVQGEAGVPGVPGAHNTLAGLNVGDYQHLTAVEKAKFDALPAASEATANKDIDGTLTANSDVKYPSQKAVKTYVDTGLATKENALGYTAEDAANKDVDGTLTANSDVKYPSQKAVKTYVDTELAAGLALKEDTLGYIAENNANKDVDGTLAANSDVKYPSQKAIKTYVDAKPEATHIFQLDGVDSYGGTAFATRNGWRGKGCSATASNGIVVNVPMRAYTTGKPITVRMLMSVDDATAGNIYILCNIINATLGASNAIAGTAYNGLVAAPLVAEGVCKYERTFTAAEAGNPTSESLLRIDIGREGAQATDTYGNTSRIIGLMVGW